MAENEVGDPRKREKLKKLIEGLDNKGMDSMMNQMMNGGGSTYKIYGDTEVKDIDFSKEYESDDVKMEKGSFEGQGTGGSGKTSWANLLVDTANQRGVDPPEKFWFDGQVYNLSAVEAPTYKTENYTVQVPNPAYVPPSLPSLPGKEDPKKDDSKVAETRYTPDFTNWLKAQGIDQREAERHVRAYEERTGRKATEESKPGGAFSREYLAWLESQRIKSDEAGNRELQEKFTKLTGKPALEQGKPGLPQPPSFNLPPAPPVKQEPVRQDPVRQEPEFLTETRQRQVQSGTEWQLSDVGQQTF